MKNKILVLLVIVLGLLASRDLFRFGYFNMHDDLQMMRQLQMEKCFLDGQVPCRWVPDMGYGYGYPLFNFYPPLPYLFGEGFRAIGVPFTDTAKYLFALSIIFSGITMYYFAKELYGKIGGFLSSAFYIWAPYHATDIYVRGAMNEAWALVWFPLIFLSAYKILTAEKVPNWLSKWGLVFSLSWFALLTSHNLMVLILAPVLGIWLMVEIIRRKKYGRILHYLIYSLLSLGLASFFTIPALFENNLTQVRSQLQGYYNYTAHFVSLRQLFVSRFWGFGGSIFGTNDGMAFQVGHIHTLFAILASVVGFLILIKKRKKILELVGSNEVVLISLYIIVVGWLSAFMAHQKSYLIWELIPQLGYLQFPWRFLTLVIFSFSIMAGFFIFILFGWIKEKPFIVRMPVKMFQIIFVFITVISVVAFNWNYFKPEGIGGVVDSAKFTGEAWRLQQTAGIYDYLPQTAKIAPDNPRRTLVEIMDGEVGVSGGEQGTYWVSFNADIESDNAVLRLNVLDFPEWRVFANGNRIEKYIAEEEMFGRIWFDLPRGEYQIYAQIFNTPIRTYANIISLVSWALFIFLVFRVRYLSKSSI